MSKFKRLEIAYPGMHGSDETQLGEEVLQDAIRNFRGIVPVTISHEAATKETIPAVGKVIRVDRPKKRLEAVIEISDDVEKAIEDNLIVGWSPGFRKGADGWYLHHLALLGSVPGKMKDLRILEEVSPEPNFADGENDTLIVFSDSEGKLKMQEEDRMTLEELAKEVGELKALTQSLEEKLKNLVANDPSQEDSDAEKKELSDKVQELQGQIAEGKKQNILAKAKGKLPKAKVDEIEKYLSTEDGKAKLFSDDDAFAKMLGDIFEGIPERSNLTEGLNFGDGKPEEEVFDLTELAMKF